MIHLPTKFEVPIFTRYGDMKGVAKCRKWGDLGWVGITQGHLQCYHWQSRAYNFLSDFNRNYAFILYRLQDIASFLSKITNFYKPRPVQISKRFLASEN